MLIWKEYIEDLYDTVNKPRAGNIILEEEMKLDQESKRYCILENEILKYTNEMKNG